MLVREIMTRDPLTAKPWSTVGDVAELLLREDIRHVPVVDAGAVVGFVSDREVRQFVRDTLKRDGATAQRYLGQPISVLMNNNVIDASADDDVDDVIEKLVEHKIGAVPVTDGDGSLVGIVSVHDVLKAAVGRL